MQMNKPFQKEVQTCENTSLGEWGLWSRELMSRTTMSSEARKHRDNFERRHNERSDSSSPQSTCHHGRTMSFCCCWKQDLNESDGDNVPQPPPGVGRHTGSTRPDALVSGPSFSLGWYFFCLVHCTHNTYPKLRRSGEGTVQKNTNPRLNIAAVTLLSDLQTPYADRSETETRVCGALWGRE